MLANPAAALQTWTAMKKHWRRLEKQMPPILLGRLVGATSQALPSSTGPDIVDFYRARPLAAGDRVLRQVREELRIAARFERTARPGFVAYLDS